MTLDASSPAAEGRLVCVHNRDRDGYQVALGLDEAGLLDVLLTDFYAPDSPPAWLPGFLRRKRHSRLPRNRVVTDWAVFVVQYAAQFLRLPMARVWRWVDGRLGAAAGRLAARRGSGLYCYHHYIPQHIAPGTPLIVFAFHPLPEHYLPALEADARCYPEARGSFAREREDSGQVVFGQPWERADAIVCASGVTARTLIADGAPPDRVAIIPYGLPGPAQDLPQGGVRAEGPARFLFVGQGIQRKGLHHLIRAWQSRERGGAMLSIVSYAIDPDIADLIRDPSIRLLGYQDRADLTALYRSHDVFIMPSLLEGFGLVYLEALSHGCHVLGTEMTGLPDLALGEDCATIVPAGEMGALEAAIDRLATRAVQDGFDRTSIAAAAMRWTQADFRAAIGDHARRVLDWHAGRGPYPGEYRGVPG